MPSVASAIATMHSSRYAKPKMLSSSLPNPGTVDRDWEAEFAFLEEDYVPQNLEDLLTPAEKARRGSLRTEGDQPEGTVKFGSGAYEGPYSFKSRFASGTGTNPEELIAAAHAGCFSMALSAALTGAGHPPTRIHTTAAVKLEQAGSSFTITEIELETEGEVPGIDEATFLKTAEEAKKTCPVSKALAGPHITLKAKFIAS